MQTKPTQQYCAERLFVTVIPIDMHTLPVLGVTDGVRTSFSLTNCIFKFGRHGYTALSLRQLRHIQLAMVMVTMLITCHLVALDSVRYFSNNSHFHD